MRPPGSLSGFVNPVRRAVWYGFSTWTPAEGSAHRTLVTSTTIVTPRMARWSQRTPARKSTAESAAAVDERRAEIRLQEDERQSGRARGRSRSAPSPAAVTRRPRSTRNPAIASTKNVFPNSDGWNWKGPRSIHRFEPRTASAKTKTKSMMPIVAP